MTETQTVSRTQMAGRVAIALVQGALLWWLYDAFEHGYWPTDQRGWLMGLVAVAVLVPAAHYLIADLADPRRQLRVLAVLAVLVLGLGWHHGAWAADEPDTDFLSFPLALGVLVFHALPFVQSALSRGVIRPRYEDLFYYAWRNALLVGLGLVFAGAFWSLLMLWGALFRMLGVDFFRDLFTDSTFAIPATTVAVGVGLQLAGSVERLQTALRRQLLTMLKWLTPLAILILVLFTVTLLEKSPELFSEQRRAISAAWLLWLVAVTVVLLNTAYQDGREEAPYPRWLGFCVRGAVVLLLPVALLAIYAIGARIDSYGVTASRAWGMLVAVIALAYAAGYAWASSRQGRWMERIGVVNVAVALFTIAMLAIMLTPVLSPERLAAASQFRRAIADPTGDAYGYLRFQSGRYGMTRLEQLAAIEGVAETGAIRARAARELQRKQRWDGAGAAEQLSAGAFAGFPQGNRVGPELLAALRNSPNVGLLRNCEASSPCPVLFADLNRDGAPEAIVFVGDGVVGAARTADGWQMLDHLQHPGASEWKNDKLSVWRALKDGDYRVGDLPWQVIEINGEYYILAAP